MKFSTPKKQGGAALILFFTMMIIAATTVLLSALNNRSPQVQDRINKQIEMGKIKEQLLGYALNYADYNTSDFGPGRLPCPDTNNDGDMNCGAATLGRLPTQLSPSGAGPISLSDRYVGIDQQFWYAVSPGFRENAATLNSTVSTFLSLDAVPEYAALIIAPGLALDGQTRSAGNQINAYLEAATVNNSVSFISEHATDPSLFNDSIITITGKEVMTYATLRAALEFKRLMLLYLALPVAAGILPADVATMLTELSATVAPNWFTNDNWASAIETYTPTLLSNTTLKFSNCNAVYTIDFVTDSVTRTPLSC